MKTEKFTVVKPSLKIFRLSENSDTYGTEKKNKQSEELKTESMKNEVNQKESSKR